MGSHSHSDDWHIRHLPHRRRRNPDRIRGSLRPYRPTSDDVARTLCIAHRFVPVGRRVAPSVVWLFAGRALMGVGVGLTAGPSTAAMVEFSAEGQSRRAASITAAAQAFGFAAALLLGG